MNVHPELSVVVMAAGKGTRMKDPSKAKVLFELNDKPMIHYVVDLSQRLGAARTILIIGYQKESVQSYVTQHFPGTEYVSQDQQLGTGHAVLQAKALLYDFIGDVLVLSGDVPLLQQETLEQLLQCHRTTTAVATILTAELADPSGYGRIIRNANQWVEKIVEHRDASAKELQVREINSGIYIFNREKLFDGLGHIKPHNVQNEYYLTDVFEYFWRHQWTVSAFKAPHPDEIRGINTVDQLREAAEVLSLRS